MTGSRKRRSSGIYRALIASSPTATVVSDVDTGLIIVANRAAELLYGFEPGAMIGLPHSQIRRTGDELGGAFEDEARNLRVDLDRDGRPIRVRVAHERQELDSGAIDIEFIEPAEPLAPRRRRESPVDHLETLGRMAGGIAHDFNNLLIPIINYGDIVRSRLLELSLAADDSADLSLLAEYMQALCDAGDSAVDLNNQLLRIAREHAAPTRLLNPEQAISADARLLRRIISDDVTLTTELDSELWPIRIDRGQFDRLIMNLCANACDAMPRGGALTVRAENYRLGTEVGAALALPSGPYVRIEVRDTGIGIPGETIDHVFEPFFTTRPNTGTGLGLANAHQVVERCGGRIEVDSELEQGTTFTVLLPAVVDGTVPVEPPRSVLPRSTAGESVLVVEDDDAVRKLIHRVLSHAGYRVVQAADGDEGLQRFEESNFDLLLTDVRMPKLNGDDLVAHVRRSRPDVQVVFMSGYTADRPTSHLSADGNATLLTKPFTNAELLELVSRLLGPASA